MLDYLRDRAEDRQLTSLHLFEGTMVTSNTLPTPSEAVAHDLVFASRPLRNLHVADMVEAADVLGFWGLEPPPPTGGVINRYAPSPEMPTPEQREATIARWREAVCKGGWEASFWPRLEHVSLTSRVMGEDVSQPWRAQLFIDAARAAEQMPWLRALEISGYARDCRFLYVVDDRQPCIMVPHGTSYAFGRDYPDVIEAWKLVVEASRRTRPLLLDLCVRELADLDSCADRPLCGERVASISHLALTGISLKQIIDAIFDGDERYRTLMNPVYY